MILNMAARAVVDLYLVMPNVHDGKWNLLVSFDIM